MGLDMYLCRAPKFKELTPNEIMVIDSYYSWKEAQKEHSKEFKYTLEEWCGRSIKNIAEEAIQYYEQFYETKYYFWDGEHKYPRKYIYESIGYWRKANAIHSWMVNNVQDGVDDCGYYRVYREQIEELLGICQHIKNECHMVDGMIQNGCRYENGKKIPIYDAGKYIENPEVAAEYLPTQSGFFFGNTDYNEWYMQDIEDTINILTKVLEETDFDNQMIIYSSSW